MDRLTNFERSERMRRVKSEDTAPELQSIVCGLGCRYRKNRRNVPGAPDLAMLSARKAIFLYGCFWHRHPDPNCPLARMPKSRQDFWGPKLTGNHERDLRNEAALAGRGWKVLTIWECQLRDTASIENKIRTFLAP